MILRSHLSLFVIALALESLFVSAVISPLAAELAAVSRNIPGVGYAHVYGAFNLAYAVGTTIGPTIGGQIYNNVKAGWTVLCSVSTGLIAMCLALAIRFTGDDPLWNQLACRFIAGSARDEPTIV